MKQVNWKELQMNKFIFMRDGSDVIINKGKKNIKIMYDASRDTYDVELSKLNKNYELDTEKLEDVYACMLQNLISKHFKFEYVMEMIINGCK